MPEIAVVVGGAFAAAFAIGVSGFADALIATAIWLHVLDPKQTVPLVAATGLVNHVLPLFYLRRSIDARRMVPFLAAGALGVPIGAWGLAVVEPDPLKIGIGGFLIVCSLFMLFRPALVPLGGSRPAADGSVGFVGGVLGGLTGLSGVLPTLWSGYRGWTTDEQRAVFETYMFFMNGVILGWLGFQGRIGAQTWLYLLYSLPAIGLGVTLGFAVYRHLDDRQFRRVVLWLLLLSGMALVL